MVQKRQCWQKRVELVEARRTQAKQRKQRSEEKRLYKALIQDLFSALDQHSDAIRRRGGAGRSLGSRGGGRGVIHIWTDTAPGGADTSPLHFQDIHYDNKEGTKSSKRRSRGESMGDSSTSERGGGGSSNSRRKSDNKWCGSISESYGAKKKSHPRSKEVTMMEGPDLIPNVLRLCRSHFFTGKCEYKGGGKKGRCPYIHYAKPYKTLASSVSSTSSGNSGPNSNGNGVSSHNNSKKSNKASKGRQHMHELAKSEAACSAATPEEITSVEPGAMDMVYYSSVVIEPPKDTTTNNKNENRNCIDTTRTPKKDREAADSTTSISDLIMGALSSHSCVAANIVYMVLDDELIFDRNRDGLLQANIESYLEEVAGIESPQKARLRRASSSLDCLDEWNELFRLPGTILEHILVFLPDSSVAAASKVCKAWHDEIGRVSPNLWRELLLRRSWPLPQKQENYMDPSLVLSLTTQPSDRLSTQSFRNQFVSHYKVLRDVKALQLGMLGLVSKKNVKEKEMTLRHFSNLKGAPQFPNSCVAVEVWASNRILAAYSQDCTLRLFKATPRAGSTEGEKFCKELVSLRIDPYQNTKRKNCRLVSMGLDDEIIGCLCHVVEEFSNSESFNLVLLSRDDFLLGVGGHSFSEADWTEKSEDNFFNVVDIREAVLNYVLCCDEVDHRLLRLHDFLAFGGDLQDVEVIASQSMASCGYGQFMLEVSISIPVDDMADDDDDDHEPYHTNSMLLIDRRLFLFSSMVGGFVWMGESTPPMEAMRPRHEDMTLAYIRKPSGDTLFSRASCNVAVVSSSSPAIMTSGVDPSGQVVGTQLLAASSQWVLSETLGGGWGLHTNQQRPIVVTSTDILVADTLIRPVDGSIENKEHKSIVTFYPRSPACTIAAEKQNGYDVIPIDGNCEVVKMVAFPDNHVVLLSRKYCTNNTAHRGGEEESLWDMTEDSTTRFMIYAIILDVTSRKELDRVCLVEDSSLVDFDQFPCMNIPISISVKGDTVAAACWWKGVIMTGDDVRSLGEDADPEELHSPCKTSSSKKKKKRKSSKGKKDVFARGMIFYS